MLVENWEANSTSAEQDGHIVKCKLKRSYAVICCLTEKYKCDNVNPSCAFDVQGGFCCQRVLSCIEHKNLMH